MRFTTPFQTLAWLLERPVAEQVAWSGQLLWVLQERQSGGSNETAKAGKPTGTTSRT
jgi:hypothetical protein